MGGKPSPPDTPDDEDVVVQNGHHPPRQGRSALHPLVDPRTRRPSAPSPRTHHPHRPDSLTVPAVAPRHHLPAHRNAHPDRDAKLRIEQVWWCFPDRGVHLRRVRAAGNPAHHGLLPGQTHGPERSPHCLAGRRYSESSPPAAELLSNALATANPALRAWHWGTWLCDPEGFAAMGVAETLLHTYCITQGLSVNRLPPAPLSAAVLNRLFPAAPPGDLTRVLLLCTGRGEVDGLSHRTSWRWEAARSDCSSWPRRTFPGTALGTPLPARFHEPGADPHRQDENAGQCDDADKPRNDHAASMSGGCRLPGKRRSHRAGARGPVRRSAASADADCDRPRQSVYRRWW